MAKTIEYGIIRKLSERYGFIRCDDGSDRFFLPMTIEPKGTPWAALMEGDRVSFEPEEHEKGLRAAHVRVVSRATSYTIVVPDKAPTSVVAGSSFATA